MSDASVLLLVHVPQVGLPGFRSGGWNLVAADARQPAAVTRRFQELKPFLKSIGGAALLMERRAKPNGEIGLRKLQSHGSDAPTFDPAQVAYPDTRAITSFVGLAEDFAAEAARRAQRSARRRALFMRIIGVMSLVGIGGGLAYAATSYSRGGFSDGSFGAGQNASPQAAAPDRSTEFYRPSPRPGRYMHFRVEANGHLTLLGEVTADRVPLIRSQDPGAAATADSQSRIQGIMGHFSR